MEQINIEANGVIPFTPSSLLERAAASGATVEMMAQLMTLQERHQATVARKAFAHAMAAAKAELTIIQKDRRASFGGGKASYDYATLAQIVATIQPVVTKHGLFHTYRTLNDERTIMVECVIWHVDGHTETNCLSAPLDFSGNKNPLHALGSSEKYLMRYTLMAGFGLADTKDDDDGHGATSETITPKQCADLELLVSEVGAQLDRVMAWLGTRGVTALAALPAGDYDMVVRKLEQFRAQKEAQS